jgi:hypothetical protein
MVRDTGFEPVTPTVSRYSGLLDGCFFSVGDSIWGQAHPCKNGKCYSEMLHRLFRGYFDISRSSVSKIEAWLRFVDDKDLMFLAEVLRVLIQDLFPRREHPGRLSDFMEAGNDKVLTKLHPSSLALQITIIAY